MLRLRDLAARQGSAFAGGVAVMGAEMAFARQAAPWFGSSLPVWAILVSVLLLALALGSAWGGRASLRPGLSRQPAAILCAAGAGLLAAAWLLPALLALAARAAEVGPPVAIAAAAAGLALAGAPLFFLGALTPALVAAWVAQDAPAGLAAGRLAAVATAGSLCGTLGTTFLWLPWLGTRATVLALAALCLAAALASARGRTRAAALGLLLATGASALLRPAPPAAPAGARLREARESAYHAAFVLEASDGTRTLRLNSLREPHSHYDPRGPTTRGVWPYFLLAQALRPGCQQPPGRVLALGLGAGTLARDLAFAFPRATVVGVEIDPVVVELGRRWFALPPATEVHVQDGRRFLEAARRRPPGGGGYDLVLVDAFQGPYLPFQLATRESFAAISALLAPGGAVAVDVLSFAQDEGLERAVARTLAAVFSQVVRVPLRPGYNSMLIAWHGGPRNGVDPGVDPRRCAQPAHPAQRAFVQATLPGARPAALDGPLLTDDHAPVEWLTHRMAWAALFR